MLHRGGAERLGNLSCVTLLRRSTYLEKNAGFLSAELSKTATSVSSIIYVSG